MQVLVGISINLCHEEVQTLTMIKEKTQGYIGRLSTSLLRLGDIIFRCQHYWQPSLKYPFLALSFALNLNILGKLHAALLPKVGVIKTFSNAMRGVPDYLGRLNLHVAEVEALVQAMHHLILLHEADNLTQFLLQTLIEYYQLELGIDKQLFTLSFEKHSNLTTETQITLLQ